MPHSLGTLAAGILLTALPLSLLAQPPKLAAKPAWRWTSDERAAQRTDPAARAERIAEYRGEMARRGGAAPPASGCDDVLNGETHPELFFVTELFPSLVTSAFISHPKIYPLVLRQEAPEVFRTEADWQRFAEIAAPYARLIEREGDLLTAKHAPGARVAEIERQLATVRAQREAAMVRALRQSRATFGRDAFDRMLYTVVTKGRSLCIADTIRDGGRSDMRIIREREDRSQ